MDEAASTTDGLGCVGPGGAPGAEPLVESSATTAAAAAAADVEVVSAPNRGESGPAKEVTAGGEARKA